MNGIYFNIGKVSIFLFSLSLMAACKKEPKGQVLTEITEHVISAGVYDSTFYHSGTDSIVMEMTISADSTYYESIRFLDLDLDGINDFRIRHAMPTIDPLPSMLGPSATDFKFSEINGDFQFIDEKWTRYGPSATIYNKWWLKPFLDSEAISSFYDWGEVSRLYDWYGQGYEGPWWETPHSAPIRYIALRKLVNGTYKYGWIGISNSPDGFVIKPWAFEK